MSIPYPEYWRDISLEFPALTRNPEPVKILLENRDKFIRIKQVLHNTNQLMNNSSSINSAHFKKCPKCGFIWASRDDFLKDSNIQLIGYQANFMEPSAGLFYFNHSCRGTLAIKAHLFDDLYKGPVFKERATGGATCPGYCLHREELEPCPAKCECAYVREIMQIIKEKE